jgi:hypothetical protein
MTKAYEKELAYELELMRAVDRAATLSRSCQCGLMYTGTGDYRIGQEAQKCEKCGKPRLQLQFLGKDGYRVLTVQDATGCYTETFFQSWDDCK